VYRPEGAGGRGWSVHNSYCDRKYCTFTVISSLTYIMLATGLPGDFFHSGFDQNRVCTIVSQMRAVFPACIVLDMQLSFKVLYCLFLGRSRWLCGLRRRCVAA